MLLGLALFNNLVSFLIPPPLFFVSVFFLFLECLRLYVYINKRLFLYKYMW